MSKSAASLSAALLSLGLAVGLGALAVGCSKNGMGATVRTDVTGRMTAAQPSIVACYETALQRSRKLRGMIVLSVTAEAKTGQFKSVRADRDELGDVELRKCVVEEVGKLKLETPQQTNITFSYPLRFSPTK